MAHCFCLTFFSILAVATFMLVISQSTPPLQLHPAEQEAVYQVLESVSSGTPWRTLFPNDLCSSARHGVVCGYISPAATPHIAELSFGFVSDYSANPPCNSISTLNPSLLAPLIHLQKLFFYRCFVHTEMPFPDFSALNRTSSLEELVLFENPALTGSLDGRISNLRRLRRLVVTGTRVSGGIPDGLGEFVDLEQLTLSRNKFSGEIPTNFFQKMKNLKVLDLSENRFEGSIPQSMGYLEFVSELNLENNNLSGRVPFSEGFISKLGGKLKLEGNLDLCFKYAKVLGHLKVCSQPHVYKTSLFHDISSISCPVIFMAVGFVYLWVSIIVSKTRQEIQSYLS